MQKNNHITLIIDALFGKEGSALALQTAEILAKDGQTTLLLDADLARGGVVELINKSENKNLSVPSLAQVLTGKKTLNQAVFKYKNIDLILGNPNGQNIMNVSESHFNILKDDFLLMAASYPKVLVKIGAFPDGKRGLIFANGADQVIITTTSNPFAITKAYEIMASLPKEIKLWLAVLGAHSDDEGSRVFITLMRALKEMQKRHLGFAGTIKPSDEQDASKVALKLGLI